MNMEGRPDLAMNRIEVHFPDTPQITHRFGFIATTLAFDGNEQQLVRGWANGRSNSLHVVDEDNRLISHYVVSDTYDIASFHQKQVHERLAKQCVAVTLFNYDPDMAGKLSDDEKRLLDAENVLDQAADRLF